MDLQALLNTASGMVQAQKFNEAELAYLEILSIDPDCDDANHQLGLLYMSMQRPINAIPYLRRTLERHPDAENILRMLTTALQSTGQFDEAVACYDQILIKHPLLVSAHFQRGVCLQALRQLPQAESQIRKVLELEPTNASAYAMLGSIYQDQGDLDLSIQSYRKSLALQPKAAAIHRSLAMLQEHASYSEEIKAMEALYEETNSEPVKRMHLAYGLGKAFDDLGENVKAFNYYLEANRLAKSLNPYDSQSMGSFFDAIENEFSDRSTAQSASDSAAGSKLIFIVGLPRSGSSLTEQILASHPQVYGAGESLAMNKVLLSMAERTGKAFPYGINDLEDEDWDELREIYLHEIFQGGDRSVFVTDKSLANFLRIGLIVLLFPAATIVHIQRNPMAIGLSMFQRFFPGTQLYSNDMNDLGHFIKSYQSLMKHWEKVLPGRFCEIHYETLAEQFEPEVRRLLEHCGLPFSRECLEFYKSKRAVQTASFNQVRQPIHTESISGWKRYEQQLSPLRRALE